MTPREFRAAVSLRLLIPFSHLALHWDAMAPQTLLVATSLAVAVETISANVAMILFETHYMTYLVLRDFTCSCAVSGYIWQPAPSPSRSVNIWWWFPSHVRRCDSGKPNMQNSTFQLCAWQSIPRCGKSKDFKTWSIMFPSWLWFPPICSRCFWYCCTVICKFAWTGGYTQLLLGWPLVTAFWLLNAESALLFNWV